MTKTVYRSFKAPAKVNLFLKTKKGSECSKFTSIITLMYPYKKIYDTISLTVTLNDKKNTTKILMKSDHVVSLTNNIIYKVVKKFKGLYKKTFSIEIYVKKRIVIGGGLGGGSSDGFYTYSVLCEIFNIAIKPQMVKNFFANISLDSCYFYYYVPAIIYQPSNVIRLLNYNPKIKFSVLSNIIATKTKVIFRNHKDYNTNNNNYIKIMKLLKTKQLISNSNLFFNDLEQTIENTYPKLAKIKQKYNNYEDRVIFTGTGSSMIVFTKEHADKI